MEVEKVAVFGMGYMGQRSTNIWSKYADVKLCIDVTNGGAELASSVGAEYVQLNPETDDLSKLLSGIDILNISSPNSTHGRYMRIALAAGVRKILVEKPATESLEEAREILRDYPDALIQTDYLEMDHPAVLAIRDEIVREKFKPTNFYNWRAHDVRKIVSRIPSGDLTKFTFSDSVHDISEIEFLMKASYGMSLSSHFPQIEARMKTWGEKYPNQYLNLPDGDIETEFKLRFPNGVEAQVKGNNDFDYRRFFIVYNKDRAYFGQTLDRKNVGISSQAAVIEGSEKVSEFVDRLINSSPDEFNTDDDFQDLYDRTDATKLDLNKYPWEIHSLEGMIANLGRARDNSELICPLLSAISIEEVMTRIYQVAGYQRFLPSQI